MFFDPFETAAILIVLATLLGFFNYRFIGLPHTIGLTVMGALASLAVIGIDWLLPTSQLFIRGTYPMLVWAVCGAGSRSP